MLRSLILLVLPLLITLASAQCNAGHNLLKAHIGNVTYKAGDVIPDQTICQSQGEGSFTFALLEYSVILTPEVVTGVWKKYFRGFIIMDNSCKLLGAYKVPECELPYTIEDYFLKDVLTITSIDKKVPHPHFQFLYANGKYSIGENGCVCGAMDDGYPGNVLKPTGCRCAFPVDGEPSRRSVSFVA